MRGKLIVATVMRMVRIQMLAVVMRARRAPVANALGRMLRRRRDEAPISVMPVSAMGVMMGD